nr:Dual specificity phosphatase domain containing protein [Haemonchus contortus]
MVCSHHGLNDMVSTPSPSTSFQQEEGISGKELEQLMSKEPLSTCILDCREGGSAIRNANRVRLPKVLFRRLVNCSLSLSTLSPRLNNADVKVVIVPEHGPDADTSNALSNALRKANISYRVLDDPVESVLSSFPLLRVDEDRPNSRSAGDVGCLNLNALRIEPAGTTPSTDKRQNFPVKILPHLLLGNYETASDAKVLERNKARYIINVTSNLPNTFEDNPAYHYLRISVDDNSSHNLSQYFPEAIAFIDAAARSGDACLVHCLAGISRSVTICLAYLMAKNKWSLEDAYDLVLRRNASIAPNFHFMGQLTEYERQLGVRGVNVGTYPSIPPLSPSCSAQAAVASGLLTPPPTSCSTSPQSSAHSAKSFE